MWIMNVVWPVCALFGGLRIFLALLPVRQLVKQCTGDSRVAKGEQASIKYHIPLPIALAAAPLDKSELVHYEHIGVWLPRRTPHLVLQG